MFRKYLVGLYTILLMPIALASAQPEIDCFTETNHCIAGAIRAFWWSHGALPAFGFPIGEERETPAGVEQQFERAWLLYDPAAGVVVQRRVSDYLEQQDLAWWRFPRHVPQEGCQYFVETGHNVCGDFLTEWQSPGDDARAILGLPLTEALQENSRTVQWLERACLERYAGDTHIYRGLIGRAITDTLLLATPMITSGLSLRPDLPPMLTNDPDPNFPADRLAAIFSQAGNDYAALVYDIAQSRIIYAANAQEQRFSASLVKLPIVMTLYHLAQQGQLDLHTTLPLRPQDVTPEDGSIQFDPIGTSYSLRELAARALFESDNTASNMLVDSIGFDAVNTLMQQLGASQTCVSHKFFDFSEHAGCGIQTSPHDMALLLMHLLRGDVAGPDGSQEILSALAQTIVRTKIPAGLPPGTTLVNKIGDVKGTGVEHDAAIIQVKHQVYILVVMGEWYDNASGIQAIAEASSVVFRYFDSRE